MQLQCKECGRAIAAEDVNINLAIAKCQSCNSVFSFADKLPAPPPAMLAAAGFRPKPEVAKPARFQLEEWGSDLSISYSWYNHAIWVLVFFCVIWDGFLVVWYGIAFGMFFMGGNGGGGMGWFALLPILFPLLHVAVGVGLTYACIATFLNRTIIRVSAGELSVWSGPMPTWGNRRIPVHEVEQFYVSESISHRKRSTSITYGLSVVLRDKQRLALISSLQSPEEARFLEQKLEQALKIEDQPTPGEYKW